MATAPQMEDYRAAGRRAEARRAATRTAFLIVIVIGCSMVAGGILAKAIANLAADRACIETCARPAEW